MSGIDVIRFAIPFWSTVFIGIHVRYHWWLTSNHHDRIEYSLITLVVSFFAIYALEEYAITLVGRHERKKRQEGGENCGE